jgi:acyl-CoA synthetase (AMP-forming)/AMP-acid ligase II
VITYPDFLAEAEKAASQVNSIKAFLASDNIPPASDLNPDRFPGLQRNPDEIVLLQHSSGTTGLQKGVALSHQAIQNQLSSYAKALHLSDEDVVVSWLPLYHDMGLIAGFILPILSGLRLVLLSPFDWVRAPQKLFQAISAYQGSLCWLPNFAYNFCAQKIRARDLEGINLSSLRAVINCSEPMSWKSQQMFRERFQPYGLRPEALATCYAMAENVFAVTQGGIDAAVTVDVIDAASFSRRHVARPVGQAAPLDTPGSLNILSAGRPIANTQVRVVGKLGQDLPERQVGEIILQSNCMLAGYYHRPDLTQEAFLDGWYLTGDLGYLANGELYVTGRKKDLIIVGGKNVYPADIERLASEVKGVHPGRVVAFGVYDEQQGTEEVALVAELDQFEQLSEAEREQIQLRIQQNVSQGSDVVVRRVHVVGKNWLLKTSSGKIARGNNRDKYLAEIT